MEEHEDIKEEELSWDDVQKELEASAKKISQQEVNDVSFEEIQQNTAKQKVNSVSFEEIQKSATNTGGVDLDFILEIPLQVTAELGRCKMVVNELLSLGQGSVIELDKMAGEPMDIFVNRRLIARGEVVVANEKFGIRLTDVVSPADRINNLK